jgi:cardiolipin synthase A/B
LALPEITAAYTQSDVIDWVCLAPVDREIVYRRKLRSELKEYQISGSRRSLQSLAVCSLLWALALSACASVPDVDKYIDNSPAAARNQILVGANGPLSATQAKAVLGRIEQQSDDTGLLQRHLAVEQLVAGTPLVVGNDTKLLRDGGQSLRAIFATIRAAKKYVCLEYYIFQDVQSDGEHLGDLLVTKRREGVAVYVIYDSYGSSETPAAFFARLKTAGVALLDFHPVNPLNPPKLNERDHRKILIADGTTAIVGGVNLSSAYESHPISKLVGSAGKPSSEHWRDTDLEIRGPAVMQLQRLFVEHWVSQGGQPQNLGKSSVSAPEMGRQIVRVIGSSSDDVIPRYYATLLSAIRKAEKYIWITTAYFVPTEDEKEDLIRAARRGVDVRLLLPSKSDSEWALAVGQANYEDLLEGGVKIYETQNEVLHSKTVVIDGVWSVIGSSNFDHRSVLFNDEVDVVVLGHQTANQLAALFRDNQRDAKPIDLATWEDRPFSRRLDETFSRVWQNLL